LPAVDGNRATGKQERVAMGEKWEYLVAPLQDAGGLKMSGDLRPDRLNQLGSEGWEAAGPSLKRGDLVA
jgi:hypothetical protein